MGPDKPSNAEEEFILKEEANRLHNLAIERARSLEAAEREKLKQLHYMHCPKCGMQLDTVSFKGLKVERCFHCGGNWLDAGELEQLAGKEHGFLHDVIALFKR